MIQTAGGRQLRKKIIRHLAAFAVTAVFSLSFVIAASATVPYVSYNYNCDGEVVESSNIYKPDRALGGVDFGVGDFYEPTDMYIRDRQLYVLDSGNNRIVVCDTDAFTAKEVYVYENGTEVQITKSTGIYVDRVGRIFIADPENKCVWVTYDDGNVLCRVEKPESEYFDQALEFLPKRVVGDSVGNIYVQCTGVYEGLVIFDSTYSFTGFYGSEKVQTTAQLLQSYFWKQFMTSEQKEAMSNYVPSEIYNMDISDDDFMYTITPGSLAPGGKSKQEPDSIRCLNPKGSDILDTYMPANIEQIFEADNRYLNFIDIVYSDTGYINVLDNKQGRIYQLDSNMQLVSAFSGLGEYVGTFKSPSAIESLDDCIYVLDTANCNITKFSLTEIGLTVHQALDLYNSGDYEASLEPWLRVVDENSNFQLAYIGIGNAMFNDGRYKEALHYYELGKYSEGYSLAFKEYRITWLRDNFVWLLATAVLLAAGLKIFRTVRAKRFPKRSVAVAELSNGRLMLYSVLHPFVGYEEMRYKKKISYRFMLLVYAALVVLGVLEQQYMGRSFSMNSSADTSIFNIAVVRLVIILLFAVSNWAFSVLMNGKATFAQICGFTMISIIPYIICGVLRVGLSHVMVASEGVFLTVLMAVGIICSFALMMIAFSVFHEYEIGRSLFIFIITIIGMLLIAILGFLIYSLAQNVIDFIKTIFSEILYRLNV